MRAWKEAEAWGISISTILFTSSTLLLHFELIYKYSVPHINIIQMSSGIKVKNSLITDTTTWKLWPKLLLLIKNEKKRLALPEGFLFDFFLTFF